jgi:hypothetical protein
VPLVSSGKEEHPMRSFGFVVAMIALLAYPFTALAATAQGIAPGTELTGTLQQTLDSAHVQVGERITLANVSSYDGSISGAKIYGHVSNVIKAGQGRNAQLEIAYDTLVTKSGARYLLQARTKNLKVNTKSNAGKELGGAAAGALLGGLIFHSGAVAAIGAGGGYIAAKNNRQNVVVPAGSNVVVQVVSARRQASQ